MKTFLLTITALWLAGSALVLAGSHVLAGVNHCNTMSEAEMRSQMQHDTQLQHVTKAGQMAGDHECPDEGCCEGVCLCKSSCSSPAATMPNILRQVGEILPMNVLPETVDLIMPVLHLLLDPPPRPVS